MIGVMVEHTFEFADPGVSLAVIEETRREESKLMARQMAAVADLLTRRTAEAEGIDPDPGWSMVTGFTRASAEVAAALNIRPMEASKLVACAEALDTRLSRIFALLADGRIDFPSVRTIVTRTELVEGELIGRVDEALVERIVGWQSWSRTRLVTTVDSVVYTIDPEAAKERRARADGDRYVSTTAQPDGTAVLRGRISATAAAAFEQRIAVLVNALCPKDSRTKDQRRADAFAAVMVGRGLVCDCGRTECPTRTEVSEQGRGVLAVINVIATDATVSGDSEQPGYLDGFGVIDADVVREIAEDAAVRPLEQPHVTEAEAHRYRPGAATARWVRMRDLTCRFPGCDRPATGSDLDHTTPFNHAEPASGGLTVPWGLAAYCREHHRVKTFVTGPNGWRDEQLADGTIVWTSPTGREYRTTPDGFELFPQMRPPPGQPTRRKRNRQRERRARVQYLRRTLRAQRPVNAAQRWLDQSRRREIERRKWRNQSRRFLILFKGDEPSKSPWCRWINEPFEPEELPPDWRPPPQPPPLPDDPPF